MNSEVYGENEAAAKGLPTFRKILSSQLLMEYSIEHTLELSSKI